MAAKIGGSLYGFIIRTELIRAADGTYLADPDGLFRVRDPNGNVSKVETAPGVFGDEAFASLDDALQRADALNISAARALAINAARERTISMIRKVGNPEVVIKPLTGASPQLGSRQTGINRAWKQEVELVNKTGSGTAPWTAQELIDIKAGKSFTDLGYTGHHINSVSEYPLWAGDPRNIAFLKQGSGNSHMTIWASSGNGSTSGRRVPYRSCRNVNESLEEFTC